MARRSWEPVRALCPELVVARADQFGPFLSPDTILASAGSPLDLALALQAEEKPAEACAAFTKVLSLEPNNKDAAAGLNMARMQAERQRRQQAGEVRD